MRIFNFTMLAMIVLIGYFAILRKADQATVPMRAGLQEWLSGIGKREPHHELHDQKQQEILALNIVAAEYFPVVYAMGGVAQWIKKTRLITSVSGALSMFTFSVAALLTVLREPQGRLGAFGGWIFVVFLCSIFLDGMLLSLEMQQRNRLGIPNNIRVRISRLLSTVIGDSNAQQFILKRIKDSFGETAPGLPYWWIYGPIPIWLPNFLSVVRGVGLKLLIIVVPCLLFGLEYSVNHQSDRFSYDIFTAFITLCIFSIAWVWPFDAVQDCFSWEYAGHNEPSFQLLVLWHDLLAE
jgi:hypothetical protein